MNVVFGNLMGLWALLGIPAVLLVHFLQERSKRVKVSTLFLLERVAPESVGGARLEKLRNSLPLWLQLLAVLVLTWLLCEPRWVRQDVRQTMVVVLDSSVSMGVFGEKVGEVLEKKVKVWEGLAGRTDWHLLSSDVRQESLYVGSDGSAMLQTLGKWQPVVGTHDVEAALVVARGLVKGAGMVVLVTDREMRLNEDVALLAVGEKVENVGVAGVKVERGEDGRLMWEVMVKNYGEGEAKRKWWLERMDGEKGEVMELELEAGQMKLLSGELAPGVERVWLKLEGDRFTWDDVVPMQLPKERVVKVGMEVGGDSRVVLGEMMAALPGVALSGGEVGEGLVVSEFGSGFDGMDGNGILVVEDGEGEVRLNGGMVVAEDHELTRGLNWMGLLTGRPRELTVLGGDEVLLWKGDRVLAFLRRVSGDDGREWEKLVLNWGMGKSNAVRNAAMLVMLHRFVDRVRQRSSESWAGNFETGQELVAPVGMVKLVSDGEEKGFVGRVVDKVGFFEIKGDGDGDGVVWLEGAARFADTREADFSLCLEKDGTIEREWEAVLKQSEADRWMPLWMLLLLGCLMVAWGKSRG